MVNMLKQFVKRRPFLAIPLTMMTKILPGYRQYRKIVRRYGSTVSVLRTAWHGTGDYYICGMYLPAFLKENGISNYVFLVNKTGSERKVTRLFDVYQGHTVQLHSVEPLSRFSEFMRQKEPLCRSFEKSDHLTFIGEQLKGYRRLSLDFEQYVRDIHRISELSGGKIGLMKLQGGEPLLNPRVTEYMKATREVFPDSPICLFTDGLLLPKVGERNDDNFWDAVRRYEIEVRMTRYPIPLDIERITQQAERHGVPVTFDPPVCKGGARLWIFSEIGALDYHGIKHSVKHPFDLSGLQEKWRWVSCYQFNESQVLRDGKVYTCPMIPYAHFFNEKFNVNLEVKEDCFIDIYKAKTMEEITEFCTHRTSFCDYCAVHHRSVLEWKQSSHDISEWTL